MAEAKAKKTYYLGTGRRKTAVARVRLSEGGGRILINGRTLEEFFTEHKDRNAVLGPNSVNTNLGVFKNFPIPLREGMRLQFRAEFFNLLNQVNLSNPNNTFSAGANFGRITGAAEARVIQFALKLVF